MKTAIALGTFDGLHKGHVAVLEKALPFNSIAVTFLVPPKKYIRVEKHNYAIRHNYTIYSDYCKTFVN